MILLDNFQLSLKQEQFPHNAKTKIVKISYGNFKSNKEKDK